MAATNDYFRCRFIFSSMIFQNIVKNAHVQFPRAETDGFILLFCLTKHQKHKRSFLKEHKRQRKAIHPLIKESGVSKCFTYLLDS